MTKAGERILEGAREMLAVAKGEQPAASVTVRGHKYVPADWQPISSAPKCGTRILVATSTGKLTVVRWRINWWTVYAWPDRRWLRWLRGAKDLLVLEDDPTHWMPLPPPPSDIGR